MIIKAADADRTMDLDIKELQDGFEYEKICYLLNYKDKCKLYQVPYILEIGDEDGSFNDIKQKFKYLEKTL